MVIAMFTGWSGRPMSEPLSTPGPLPVPFEAAPDPGADIECSMRQGLSNTVVLNVASPEVSMRKTVYPDGHGAIEVVRGCDRAALTTTDTTLTVVRAHRTVTINTGAPSEEDMVLFREPLVASPAVRSFRVLSAAVEELGQERLEHLGVRLAGVLVAHFDGDCGAIPRFCRALETAYGRRPGGARRPNAAHWAVFRKAVLRAARQMHGGMDAYTFWNPTRCGYAFTWLGQVESAWHACVLADMASRPSDAFEAFRRR